MYCNYKDNLAQAIKAAESVLNEHNTEVYMATSRECHWRGCNYTAFENHSLDNLDQIADDIYQIATNIAAMGIFNSANASMTFHCTYNPETKQYTMRYMYYIVDFYDFSNFDIVYHQDLLGIARSYELFGECSGVYTWKAGEQGQLISLEL